MRSHDRGHARPAALALADVSGQPPEPADSPAARLRGLRASLALSQEQLARQLGVSFATVNRWESGRTRMSDSALRGLAELEARSAAPARSRVGVGMLLDSKGEDGEHRVGPIIGPTQHALTGGIVEVPLLLDC